MQIQPPLPPMKVTSEFPFLAGVAVIILCFFLGFGGCMCLVSYGDKLEAEGKAVQAAHSTNGH